MMMGGIGMMRCDDALARLWDLLDGELPPDEEAAVKRHLEVCGRCYPQYDFQRTYMEYTRRLAAQEHAPPELRKRLFQRILEQERAGGNGR